MIIIPGSKNTMGDLKWLRESGFESLILRHASQEKVVFGVCGGYQMLGEELSDPYVVEEGGTMRGLGLLPIDTVFEKQKRRTQVQGNITSIKGLLSKMSDAEFEGYEIHMGISTPKEDLSSLAQIDTVSGKEVCQFDGYYNGNVYGSYIHGLFDKEEIAKSLIISLYESKGLNYDEVTAIDMKAYKDEQYDKLAQIVRENIDMDRIYEIIGNNN